jgi:ribonuclease HI
MAESAALALATCLCRNMNLEHLNLFTDTQLLVECINGPDPSNPPDWRIKPFTQLITASLNTSSMVHKIPRTQNQMADSLARHALHSLLSFQPSSPVSCTNPSHTHECRLRNALQLVTDSWQHLAANF